MKIKLLVAQSADGRLWHKALGQGRAVEVCTIQEACKVLRRTRRQVYRYIADRALNAPGKFLGEWLVERRSVIRLAKSPPSVQRIPAKLQPLFPEYELSMLNAGTDRVLILSRVLESGTLEDLRWVLKRYSKQEMTQFIVEDGPRLLSPRSLKLWELFFQCTPSESGSWRFHSNPWIQK